MIDTADTDFLGESGPNILERIATHYTKLSEIPRERGNSIFHVSYLAGNTCLLAPALTYLEYKDSKPFNPGYNWDARLGEAIHKLVQDDLIAINYIQPHPTTPDTYLIETPLNEEILSPQKYNEITQLKIGGRVDGISTRPSVIEIKTLGSKYFYKYMTKYLDKKYNEFMNQVDFYAYFLELDMTEIIVIDRGNRDNRFVIEHEPRDVTPRLEEIYKAATALDRGGIPEPKPSEENCFFCGLREYCPAYK